MYGLPSFKRKTVGKNILVTLENQVQIEVKHGDLILKQRGHTSGMIETTKSSGR
jgi:hypothetical protein